jgi:SRSO17 transposase
MERRVTRASTGVEWRDEFRTWLAPFLAAFGRAAQRHWAPRYLEGLLGPGERKSVEPMATRVCPGETQQLHHFISTSPWATEPLERVLAEVADRLVGGPEAVLIIDDTALPKQGTHSVGVARQYCGALGKRANCQVLVSLTLAHGEVPVPLALRLYLPEAWADDADRRERAKVPAAVNFQTKGALALAELDRVTTAGVHFGLVLADAGYGTSAEFRAGLTTRGLRWAVGILGVQKVYPATVTLAPPTQGATGRPQTHPVPSAISVQAEAMIDGRGPRAFRRLTWRRGTKGPLVAAFAAVRVRAADGPLMARAQHLPGDAAWLVCVAGVRATRDGRAEILPDESPGPYLAHDPRPRDQSALGLRASAPATQGRTGARSFRGPLVAGAPSPRAPHDDRLRLPPAPSPARRPSPAGRGKNQRRRPAHRPTPRCPRSGATSSQRCAPYRTSDVPAVTRTSRGRGVSNVAE